VSTLANKRGRQEATLTVAALWDRDMRQRFRRSNHPDYHSDICGSLRNKCCEGTMEIMRLQKHNEPQLLKSLFEMPSNSRDDPEEKTQQVHAICTSSVSLTFRSPSYQVGYHEAHKWAINKPAIFRRGSRRDSSSLVSHSNIFDIAVCSKRKPMNLKFLLVYRTAGIRT
jgi:hypothetical protein